MAKLITLHEKITVSVDECREVGSHLDFLGVNKVFDTLFCKILIEKLTKYGLDEETLRGTVNWLKTQTVVASGIKSSWSTVAGSVCQRSAPSHTIFIEVLDDGAECNLSWFVDVLIQGGVDDQRL